MQKIKSKMKSKMKKKQMMMVLRIKKPKKLNLPKIQKSIVNQHCVIMMKIKIHHSIANRHCVIMQMPLMKIKKPKLNLPKMQSIANRHCVIMVKRSKIWKREEGR